MVTFTETWKTIKVATLKETKEARSERLINIKDSVCIKTEFYIFQKERDECGMYHTNTGSLPIFQNGLS